ncbi:hypothetical protein ScPMuIL_011629 [Solemya velum]
MDLAEVLCLAALASITSAQMPANLDLYGLINILYIKADRNGDGIISQAELDGIYHGFDANDDSQVTEAEFIPLWQGVTQQPHDLAAAIFHLADLNNDNIINQQDLSPIYGRFDINGNGNVTAQEFATKWEEIIREAPFAVLFLRADTDHNNHLSTAEFGTFFSPFDANSNHVVTRAEFHSGWQSMHFGGLANAAKVFAHADTNHDGELTSTDTTALLSSYDANHNSLMEILEISQMSQGIRPVQSTAQVKMGATFLILVVSVFACCMASTEPERELMLFDRADRNHDGELTFTELSAVFMVFDINHDQNVTRAEFATSWVTNLRLGGTSEAEMLFDRADATDDGIVTLTDLPFIFNFFDMDHDGHVQLIEFLEMWSRVTLHAFVPETNTTTIDIG